MMTIQSELDSYYDIIDFPGYHLIVIGEIGEQWTDEVLSVLEMEDIHVDFFPWVQHVDLRLQLEVIYYPITQLWQNGSLKMEFVGYHNESVKDIVEQIK
jgi:hypothetical protein